MVSRRFLGGAAAGLLILTLGLSVETRFPDQNGVAGHDKVSIHGVPILDRVITPADVPGHSPWPVIGAVLGAISLGAIGCGMLYHLLGRQRSNTTMETSLQNQKNES